MVSRFSSVAVLASSLGFVNALLNYSIPANKCESPTGFNNCVAPVNDQFAKCLSQAGSDTDKALACACVGNPGILNCVYENCWNVVYSCEVQEFAALFVQSCIGAQDIPYYPVPDNAPGACSCNIEKFVIDFYGSLGTDYLNCQNRVSGSVDLDGISACTCCAQAGAYAALYGVCPTVDPQALLQTVPGASYLLGSYFPQFSSCGSILRSKDCVRDTGYPALSDGLSYLSRAPTSTGSASYSNLAGTLTAPSAAKVTWTPFDYLTLTATAVSVGKIASPGSSSGSRTGNAGSAAPTGTSNTSPITSTPTGQGPAMSISKFLLTMVLGSTFLTTILF